MSYSFSHEWPFYMTATIAGFKHLFEEEKEKRDNKFFETLGAQRFGKY